MVSVAACWNRQKLTHTLIWWKKILDTHVCFIPIILDVKTNVQTHSIHVSCTNQSREKLINKEDCYETFLTIMSCPLCPRLSSLLKSIRHKIIINLTHSRVQDRQTAERSACTHLYRHLVDRLRWTCVCPLCYFLYSYLHSLLNQNLAVNLGSKPVKYGHHFGNK